jgi:hypothetical protein
MRDDAGTVLRSAWRVICNAASAEEVEIMACREGITLAAELLKPTVLESDCLAAINQLSNTQGQRSSLAFLLREAILTAHCLPEVVFKHVRREQNCVAHELAQLARKLNHSSVWRNRVPVCVEHLVARDCNISLSN